ncbi:MAG: FAD-dependent oxidoreductase [Spirochaetaceae bacterium]|nr:FAD-dependent oxidoreductase [Spirochaetaceae bacterium]
MSATALNLVSDCDLLVVGGGAGGFAAALAGARLGARTVLVEKSPTLGGNAVRCGVNCWEPGAGGTGIPYDLYRRLRARPDAVGIYSFGRHLCWYDPEHEPFRFPGGEQVIDRSLRYLDTLRRFGSRGLPQDERFCRRYWHGVPFEPRAMHDTMRRTLEETGGCRVQTECAFTSVAAAGGIVREVVLDNGERIRAGTVVDATADLHLCAAAGCELTSGQEPRSRYGEPDAPERPSGRINGVSLIYRVAHTGQPGAEPLPASVPARCWWRGAGGSFPVSAITQYPNGDLNVNMLPTMEGAEFQRRGYADAYAECERRVRAHWHDLQSRFAEFRGMRRTWVAPGLGVRESRRVVGEYVLTEHDLLAGLSGQRHDDIVCIADHAMDTHGSHGRPCGELSEPYGVPFRCLIPRGFRNLLVACRGASFSALAASSCRLTRTMMQLGQAAGTAAALAVQLGLPAAGVPAKPLRAALARQHVQLSHPLSEELLRHLSAESAPD